MTTPIFALLLTLTAVACGDGDNPADSPSVGDESGDPPAYAQRSPLLFRDQETGTTWNLVGEAVSGELAGSRLEQIPAYSAYWFAWSSFWPQTAVWGHDAGTGAITDGVFGQIDPGEFVGDLPRDSIPTLDDPYAGSGYARFVAAAAADYLDDLDAVIGVVINGDARAYPVGIMNYHEIVNHTVGDRRIIVTYCPLTASGINFAADDIAFSNTGGLYISNLVMYDRNTESFWGQMRTASIHGERAGERLQMLPVYQGTWTVWKRLYPDTQVLSTDTGRPRDYDNDPFVDWGYHQNEEIWFPRGVTIDGLYHPKAMVLGLVGTTTAKAYPHLAMRGTTVVNDTFEGRDIVVVYNQAARAALAFCREVAGQSLSFVELEE